MENQITSRRFADASLHIYQQWIKYNIIAFPTLANSFFSNVNYCPSTACRNCTSSSESSHVRSKRRTNTTRSDEKMDFNYVTQRIIALSFATDITSVAFDQGHQNASTMLTSKHSNNYMIFNLSESDCIIRNHHEMLRELGWPSNTAPALERLCTICKDIESWLTGNVDRVVVLHCRGNKDRIGIIIAAYMNYSSICGTIDQALDRFVMNKFLQDKIGEMELPSYNRYVEYFAGLLSGDIKMNSAALLLTHVTVLGSPCFQVDGGGCKAFIKVYEGLVPVYTSGIHSISCNTRQFTINIASDRHKKGLQLRGDIIIKCYHRHYTRDMPVSNSSTRCSSLLDGNSSAISYSIMRESSFPQREVIFACQLHTCAINDYTITFTRHQLDYACNDLRFPLDGAVELYFSPSSDSIRQPSPAPAPAPAPTPAVPVNFSFDPVTQWDSYSNVTQPITTPTLQTHHVYESGDQRQSRTCSSVDGYTTYATVCKNNDDCNNAAGITSQTRSLSMDSGISSAGNGLQLLVNTAPTISTSTSTSTSNTHRHKHDSSTHKHIRIHSEPHQDLDQLLTDMLLTVENIRDIELTAPCDLSKTNDKSVVTTAALPTRTSMEDVDFAEKDIPYHARQHSRPFTYGTVLPNEPTLSSSSQKSNYANSAARTSTSSEDTRLSSPTLVRKINGPSKRPSSVSRRSSSPERFHEGVVVKADIINGGTIGTGNITWLQRQQQKLRERRQYELRAEREPHESRLLSELRQVQHRGSSTRRQNVASHRSDGYTSDTTVDTTVFDDDNDNDNNNNNDDDDQDEDDHMKSLLYHKKDDTLHQRRAVSPNNDITLRHRTLVNPTQQNLNTISSSRAMCRQKSLNERPFVAVKKAHQQTVNLVANNTHTDYLSKSMNSPERISSPSSDEKRTLQTPITIDNIDSLSITTDHVFDENIDSIQQQSRSDTYNTWRSTYQSSDGQNSRPQTPAFPVHPRTPYGTAFYETSSIVKRSPTFKGEDWYTSCAFESTQSDGDYGAIYNNSLSSKDIGIIGIVGIDGSNYSDSSKSPLQRQERQPVSSVNVKFVRNTSKFWYKPNISREEVLLALKDKPPGCFIVRDSGSFPGAFGLAVKVATPPASVTASKMSSDPSSELVRHFLIEPTPRGVKLRGCPNEPVFSSLSALIYQHSVTPLALPCRLTLPNSDYTDYSTTPIDTTKLLLDQGAACNVLYLLSVDTESLTGPQAITKAANVLFSMKPFPEVAVVHFKVSCQGITLTDNKRKVFFRRHYTANTISYCSLDPQDHRWTQMDKITGTPISSHRCFAFVARKLNSPTENQCHLFAELEPEQPAIAIVNFVCKVMMINNNQGHIML